MSTNKVQTTEEKRAELEAGKMALRMLRVQIRALLPHVARLEAELAAPAAPAPAAAPTKQEPPKVQVVPRNNDRGGNRGKSGKPPPADASEKQQSYIVDMCSGLGMAFEDAVEMYAHGANPNRLKGYHATAIIKGLEERRQRAA